MRNCEAAVKEVKCGVWSYLAEPPQHSLRVFSLLGLSPHSSLSVSLGCRLSIGILF